MFIVWNRLNWSSMPLKSLWKRLFFQGKIQRVNAFYKILGMAPGWTRSPRWWQQQEPKDNKNNKRRQREFRNSQLWRNLKTVFTVQKVHSEDQEPCRWCHTSEQHRISFWFLHLELPRDQHQLRQDYIYGRYVLSEGSGEVSEQFFPILWTTSGNAIRFFFGYGRLGIPTPRLSIIDCACSVVVTFFLKVPCGHTHAD